MDQSDVFGEESKLYQLTVDKSVFYAYGITRNILKWIKMLEQNFIFQVVQYKIVISYVPHGHHFDPI